MTPSAVVAVWRENASGSLHLEAFYSTLCPDLFLLFVKAKENYKQLQPS